MRVLSSLFTLWWQQPAVVHFHSWKLASLSWLLALISPQSTFVWTIDEIPRLPHWLLRLTGYLGYKICDVVTTPTRTLQYRLLNTYNLLTGYIPDGYALPTTPDIPAKHFGLTRGQYILVFADDATSLKLVLDAYKATKRQKKLVIFHELTPAAERLQRKYPFLRVLPYPYERGLYSLLQQALLVIFADDIPRPDLLLAAMGSGKSIISTTLSMHQELLGVTGQYYKPGDELGLLQALKTALRSQIQRRAWSLAAKLRASHHFTWERITAEYMQQYTKLHFGAPIDSLQPQISLPVRRK